MNFENLNDANFLLYAATNYNNPQCKGLDEFQEDLNRIVYIKRLLNRHKRGGELRERLILNHIIIICNVFGIEPGIRIMLYKLEESLYDSLKTFFIYLKYLKPDAKYIHGVDFQKVGIDYLIYKRLKDI